MTLENAQWNIEVNLVSIAIHDASRTKRAFTMIDYNHSGMIKYRIPFNQ